MVEHPNGLLESKVSIKDAAGRWVFDTVADRIPGAHLYEAVQRLRAAGFTIDHPGNRGIEIRGPAPLYEEVLGKYPCVPGLERLDGERLKGTAYEPLIAYVAGFEFAL